MGTIAGGKVGNCKGRKNPRWIQRHYFLIIYGQLKHFSRSHRSIAHKEKLYEKYDRIWTFILLDPMDLSFFLNEVLWQFQGPDLICGATCFPAGHNLKPYTDRNLFAVEFCLRAELWFGESSAWSCRFFQSQWSITLEMFSLLGLQNSSS